MSEGELGVLVEGGALPQGEPFRIALQNAWNRANTLLYKAPGMGKEVMLKWHGILRVRGTVFSAEAAALHPDSLATYLAVEKELLEVAVVSSDRMHMLMMSRTIEGQDDSDGDKKYIMTFFLGVRNLLQKQGIILPAPNVDEETKRALAAISVTLEEHSGTLQIGM